MSQLRQQKLLEIVQSQGYTSIEVLAQALGCSQPTIRRDIKKLCEENLLQRFHGGVTQAESDVRLGHSFKNSVMTGAKAAIAAAALNQLRHVDSFFLDTGTTCDQLAGALAALPATQIITHNLSAALIIAKLETRHSVVVTGGTIRGADGSLTGAKTCQDIRSYSADCAVICASGLDGEGNVLDFDLEKVEVKKAMMQASTRKILLLDSSKFRKRGAVKLAPLQAFDLCITDSAPEGEYAELFASRSVDCITS
ncbi:DeoR/GlpR family DNA-binding transcription regulator [Marinobacterium lutimaris]|uniref:Transcriptional regulator, DeoR family n=1 Tax=Marinobacterium lutimaris TaxID=568106 RepID=A0A1H6DN09_9GAMM|nr:DeoR/GlpR family DNA-binding transcription regulator [Marinobacterium lutimaris]SEG86086.1 transcriptional regulator, DeoR family [Marinobacterium lutimaris]